jgi:hypothetical protein
VDAIHIPNAADSFPHLADVLPTRADGDRKRRRTTTNRAVSASTTSTTSTINTINSAPASLPHNTKADAP